ncbi:MAG: TIGR00730 family Rossman fold protein [Bacteroidales bacterium]|nr:TIGR00730 family Rossman fold protein [Bacteroidales bacterium]
MNSICVFCGSSLGIDKIYREETARLGVMLASCGVTVIYGGGKVGLMGILAESILHSGGTCIGIMPRAISDLEIAHDGLTRLVIVESMAERKACMAEMADAFIALPGGLGTLDELAEILTLNQLRISDKPIGLLNINGYFDHLTNYFDHAVREGFIREEHHRNLIVSADPAVLLEKLQTYRPVGIDSWIADIKKASAYFRDL